MHSADRRAWAGRATLVLIASVVAALLMTFAANARSQELQRAVRQPWTLYVFVSTTMPHDALVALAREAGQAHAALVFRGFPSGKFDLLGEQQLVAQLDAECCEVRAAALARSGASTALASPAPRWLVDPAIYHQFDVNVVPTFVLAATGAAGEQGFSKVAGDMALASALKFFAQKSAIEPIRQQAAAIYQATYGGRQ